MARVLIWGEYASRQRELTRQNTLVDNSVQQEGKAVINVYTPFHSHQNTWGTNEQGWRERSLTITLTGDGPRQQIRERGQRERLSKRAACSRHGSLPPATRTHVLLKWTRSFSTIGYTLSYSKSRKVLKSRLSYKVPFFLLVMSSTLKSLLNLLPLLFLFYVWFLGLEACGIFAPQPGVECAPPVLESKVLTTDRQGSPPKYLSDHNERKLEVSNKRKTRKSTDTIDGKQHILRELLGQRSNHKRNLKMFRDGELTGSGLLLVA